MGKPLFDWLRRRDGAADRLRDSSLKPHEIVALIWRDVSENNPAVLDKSLEELLRKDVPGACADHERALEAKAAGNAAFQQSDLQTAAAHYSECLLWTNQSQQPELASMAYCNRALCALRLGAYGQAESDATMSLRIRPSDKAHFHRARALAKQDRWVQAIDECHATLKLRANNPQVQTFLEMCLASVEAHDCVDEGGIDEPSIQPAHTGVSSLTDSLTAAKLSLLPVWRKADDEALGRELVTGEAVDKGALTLEEKPFAWCLTCSGRKIRCATCGKKLVGIEESTKMLKTGLQIRVPTGIPCFYECCPRCPLVRYCNPACRDADQFHCPGGLECGLPWPSVLSRHALLASRFLRAVKGSETVASGTHEVHNSPPPASSLESGTSLFDADERLVHGMTSILCAAIQLLMPETTSALAEGTPGEQWSEMLANNVSALLERAVQHYWATGIVRVNGFALHGPCYDGSEEPYGHGIYSLASMVNHSCQPNTMFHFKGCMLQIHALQDLATRAQLWHCYGGSPEAMSVFQRRAELQLAYGFICQCPLCTDPCAEERAAQLTGIACPFKPGCKGAVIPKNGIPKGITSDWAVPPGSGICTRCGCSDTSLGPGSRVVEKLRKLEKWICMFGEPQDRGDGPEALRILKDCIKKLEPLLPKSSLDIAKMQRCLARLIVTSPGMHLEDVIPPMMRTFATWYSPSSPEYLGILIEVQLWFEYGQIAGRVGTEFNAKWRETFPGWQGIRAKLAVHFGDEGADEFLQQLLFQYLDY